MPYETVRYDVAAAVATITLDRPDAYNALNLQLARELHAAAREADEDAAIRCVVLTGAGKAFCGGGDVKDFAKAGPRAGLYIKELTTDLHGAISRLCRAPKPVVVAVNGIAAGGGLGLALCGDVVVAAESARFTMAYANIAASPDASSTWLLPRLVGVRRALELYLTNRVLSASEALAEGLISRVHPDPDLPGAAAALARELAAGPTVAFGRAKRLFYASSEQSLETQMELEARAIAACAHTEDFAGAVAAFAAKRTHAPFRGR